MQLRLTFSRLCAKYLVCLLCAGFLSCEKLIELPDDGGEKAEIVEDGGGAEEPAPDNNGDTPDVDGDDEEASGSVEDVVDNLVEESWGLGEYADDDLLTVPSGAGYFVPSEALALNLDGIYGHPLAVRGYIVGYVSGSRLSSAKFGLPETVNTNLLLADSPDEADPARCFPVFLQQKIGGLPFREMINLRDHPEYLGRRVEVGGWIETYFGVNGIKRAWGIKIFVPELPPSNDL